MTKRPPAPRALGAPSVVLLASLICASVALAACGGSSGSPGPSGSPGSSPGASGSLEIDHPTGATDVVLQFEEGGGFVPMGFLAGQAPSFTLYGDGTTIFRDWNQQQPAPIGDAQPQLPYQIVRLTEDQIQELLAFVIGPGGLGVARADYLQGGIADAPTAVFTLSAGGLTKKVSVLALGFDNPQSPDAVILKALATAGDRLRGFKAPGAVVWTPERYRGILSPDAFGNPRGWPWPDVTPADFKELTTPTGQTWNARTMSAAEIDAIGMEGIEGGVINVVVNGPGDGVVYSFTLRPLLPDEAA
jgi:hypothetical protein